MSRELTFGFRLTNGLLVFVRVLSKAPLKLIPRQGVRPRKLKLLLTKSSVSLPVAACRLDAAGVLRFS